MPSCARANEGAIEHIHTTYILAVPRRCWNGVALASVLPPPPPLLCWAGTSRLDRLRLTVVRGNGRATAQVQRATASGLPCYGFHAATRPERPWIADRRASDLASGRPLQQALAGGQCRTRHTLSHSHSLTHSHSHTHTLSHSLNHSPSLSLPLLLDDGARSRPRWNSTGRIRYRGLQAQRRRTQSREHPMY